MDQPVDIPRSKRIHRDRQQWQTLVDEFEASDLSQRAFCRQVGISHGTFTRWRRRLVGADTQAPRTPPETGLFVELSGGSVTPAAGAGWDVELQLGPGVFLRLRQPAC